MAAYEIIYNGKDVTGDVLVKNVIHEQRVGGGCDSLEVSFNDATALWNKYGAKYDDTIRFRCGNSDSGDMFVLWQRPENGVYTIYARSMPRQLYLSRARSFENITFDALAAKIAEENGLGYEAHGCGEINYPYISQRDDSDFHFLDELTTKEDRFLMFYDRKIVVADRLFCESRDPGKTTQVGEGASFSYEDNSGDMIENAVVIAGEFMGGYTDPNVHTGRLFSAKGIRATSDGECRRFAKGILKDINKDSVAGVLERALSPDIQAASLLDISTLKCPAFDGTALVSRVRHNYEAKKTKVWFRRPLK